MTIDYRGTTALITGASSGLGVEFARQLAARGANLVLVARRKDRLDALAEDLRAHVDVATVAADLAKPGAAAALAKELAKRKLSVHTLVNNAGFGTSGPFIDEDPARLNEEIDLNVGALVNLSRTFLPGMLAHDRGALINVASTAAFQPLPTMAVYGATKAFVLSFTEAIWYETKKTGVGVLCLCPGATATEFFDIAGNGNNRYGRMAPAADVVALALKTLDKRNPPPSVMHGARNRVNTTIGRYLLNRRANVDIAAIFMRARD